MNKEKGFTLIEFLIVILITGIISVAMISLLFAIIKLWNVANARLTIYQNLRAVFDVQAYEIRGALRTKPVTNGGHPLWMFKGSNNVSYSTCDRLDIVSATEGNDTTPSVENYNFYKIGYRIYQDATTNTYDLRRIIKNELTDGSAGGPPITPPGGSGEQFGMFFTSFTIQYYDGSWDDEWDDETELSVPVGVTISATATDDLNIYGDPTVLDPNNGLLMKTSVYVPVSTMEN